MQVTYTVPDTKQAMNNICLPSLSFISKGTKIPGPKMTCLRSHNNGKVGIGTWGLFWGRGVFCLRSINEGIEGQKV